MVFLCSLCWRCDVPENYDNFLLTSRGGRDDKTDIYLPDNNCTHYHTIEIGLIADQSCRGVRALQSQIQIYYVDIVIH